MRRMLMFAAPAVCAGTLLLIGADNKLPAPYSTPDTKNAAKVVAQRTNLHVPQGFEVKEIASGLGKPRAMFAIPGTTMFLVSDSLPEGKGAVYALDRNGGEKKSIAQGLDRPYGVLTYKGYLYVAEPRALKRYTFDSKSLSAQSGQDIIKLPDDFDKGHWTRSIAIDPKVDKLYMEIGSGSNADPDADERRATVLECGLDGSNCQIYARGLRNATGIHFRPGTSELWATVQERDGLGEDLVPDFFTKIKKGGFYGWPWAYFGPNEDPRNAGKHPELVKATIVPDINLGAHVAVMDWTFYSGKQFPEQYRGGAFFAFRGSSNRAKRVGYSIGYLPFGKNGMPSAQKPEDFLTGFMLSPDSKEVLGRPVGVAQLQDGSLVVSEDGANKIYRVTYGTPK